MQLSEEIRDRPFPKWHVSQGIERLFLVLLRICVQYIPSLAEHIVKIVSQWLSAINQIRSSPGLPSSLRWKDAPKKKNRPCRVSPSFPGWKRIIVTLAGVTSAIVEEIVIVRFSARLVICGFLVKSSGSLRCTRLLIELLASLS